MRTQSEVCFLQWHNGIISGVELILKLRHYSPGQHDESKILAESAANREYSFWPDESGRTRDELARDARDLDAFATA